MSSFTARSPSPNSRSSSVNRSSRTPESSSSLRKSADLSSYSLKFSSPLDSSHKSFNSKHFSSQKENERGPTCLSKATTKGRSPVITSSSSSSHKGFMAPTISASSKGRSPALPSPRARAVLSERNQNPTQIEEIFSRTDSKTSPVVPPLVTSPVPKLTQSDPEPSVSLPPYDPKTNYLSPRPQYLHYKPIPRIELYKKGELDLFDGRNLEDSFSSESTCSESSVKTEEEESSPSELIESDEMETEAVSSEIDLPEAELPVPISNAATRSKLKIAPLALIMLLIGCIFLPLSDSPLLTSESNLKHPSLHLGALDTRLMEFSSRLSHWSTQSIQYLSNLFAIEASFPIQIGTFPLANLSSNALDESRNLDSILAWPILSGESVSNEMEAKSEAEEKNTTVGLEVRNEDVERIQERFEEIEIKEGDDKGKVETETGSSFGSEPSNVENPEEGSSIVNEMDDGFGSESHPEKNPEEEPIKVENPEESIAVETVNELDKRFGSEPVKAENPEEITINEVDNVLESESVKEENPKEDTTTETYNEVDSGFVSAPVKEETKYSNLISNPAIGMIALIAISSLASLAIISAYLNKNRVLVSQPTTEKATPVKKQSGISDSCSGSSESHVQSRGSLETSSVDMETEFSTSFDRTDLSTGTDWKSGSKNSGERLFRRESEVSNGSFGSFTTYEKISTKKVNGETPVRRSSRIRSRVTSS